MNCHNSTKKLFLDSRRHLKSSHFVLGFFVQLNILSDTKSSGWNSASESAPWSCYFQQKLYFLQGNNRGHHILQRHKIKFIFNFYDMNKPRPFSSLVNGCQSTPYSIGDQWLWAGCWLPDRHLVLLDFLAFERSVRLQWDRRENGILTKAIFREEMSGILVHEVNYKPVVPL